MFIYDNQNRIRKKAARSFNPMRLARLALIGCVVMIGGLVRQADAADMNDFTFAAARSIEIGAMHLPVRSPSYYLNPPQITLPHQSTLNTVQNPTSETLIKATQSPSIRHLLLSAMMLVFAAMSGGLVLLTRGNVKKWSDRG